jgi:hypothetical protein
VPVTFNTGQILLGLAAGTARFGKPYRSAMLAAADWLVDTQHADGCWRDHSSPFAAPGERTYDTHVAWGLLEAARVTADDRYAAAALRNVAWACTRQTENGWFASCCLSEPARPLTHTLGYTMRGIVEAYRHSRAPELLSRSRRLADGLVGAIDREGFLPGRLDARFCSAVPWACLTGSAQIAHCLLLLYCETRDERYRNAGYALNRYVRRTVRVADDPDTCGGIKGSFPVTGGYGRYEYLNWAAKFFIDANLLERSVRRDDASR